MQRLLLIDDEADVRYSFRRMFDAPDIEIVTAASGEEGLRLLGKTKPDLVIMDVRMGGMSGLETLRRMRETDARLPIIVMTAYGTTQTAIEAMKLGAYDYLLKPFDVPRLKQTVFGALKAARDMKEVVSCEPFLEPEDSELGIVGRSEAMQEVFKLIGQAAPSEATVLITGESGTGKELVARAIYQHSPRSQRAFMAINCAAIPEQLLESELFGHEKGAFTGATSQRIGKFEQCHRGTIFLDEIGDMSLTTQTRILRVLQSGTFERVGGNQTVTVSVRIIAATNRNLEEAVAKRQFREDLFYRLNVVRIHLPPLRERKEDIPPLVQYFLKKFCSAAGPRPKSVTPDVLRILEQYGWPGNVRELENVVQRAVVMCKGEALLLNDLPGDLLKAVRGVPPAMTAPAGASPAAPAPPSVPGDLQAMGRALFEWARSEPKFKILPAVERELIVQALRETSGNQVQAARLLGITRATLRKRIEKFNIKQEISVR